MQACSASTGIRMPLTRVRLEGNKGSINYYFLMMAPSEELRLPYTGYHRSLGPLVLKLRGGCLSFCPPHSYIQRWSTEYEVSKRLCMHPAIPDEARLRVDSATIETQLIGMHTSYIFWRF